MGAVICPVANPDPHIVRAIRFAQGPVIVGLEGEPTAGLHQLLVRLGQACTLPLFDAHPPQYYVVTGINVEGDRPVVQDILFTDREAVPEWRDRVEGRTLRKQHNVR
jgi:hypothetical protein